MQDKKIYDIALSFISGAGDVIAKKLLCKFGNAEILFNSKLSDLQKVQGIGEVIANKIYSSFDAALIKAEDELKYLLANDIDCVSILDDDYPSRLKECEDAPIILYYKGKNVFNVPKIISIVGTRNASSYGMDFCKSFINDLALKYPDTVIVSGLAYGIDITAHKEAIKNNLLTIAVLGHGLEMIYPAKHKKIANKIIEDSGALVTDYYHNSKVEIGNFVKRNRIVAGISQALIVVESGVKGGSIITANIANHYNKDVFALPGNINANYSQGCNKLIKTNRANLIEGLDDLEYILNWKNNETKIVQSKMQLYSELSDEEQSIVNVLKNYEYLDIDNICRQTNLNINVISIYLLELEFKKIIRALPGKIFTLK